MAESKTLKVNKHALFKYSQDEKIEAGIVLSGQDVKDFKSNKFEIRDAVIRVDNNEAFVYNVYLESSPEVSKKRKLLLKSRQIYNLAKSLQNKRLHAYVMSAYINQRGLVKLGIGIGTIKKKFEHKSSEKRTTEKRQTEKYIADNL